MRNPADNSDLLYQLKPDQFEKLVMELLSAEGYKFSDNIVLAQGVDFIATKEEKHIGVIIKHRRELNSQAVREIFDNQPKYGFQSPWDLLFVTSARITEQQANTIQLSKLGYHLEIIAHDELQKLLSKHSEIAEKHLKPVRQRLLFEKIKGSGAILVILVTLAIIWFPWKKSQPLDARIQNVEAALSSIRDLEGSLSKVRDDMVATENATREINRQNAAAKELQKSNDAAIELLIQKYKSDKWWNTALGWGFSFLTGIATSYIASVFFEKRNQRKALESGS